MQRLFALRGANSVERNDAESILSATSELIHELMSRNGLMAESMVSCLFTLTEDLDAEFPAVAARALGLSRVPLMCMREVPVPGSLPRVIRTRFHYYRDEDPAPGHVSLGEPACCGPISSPRNKPHRLHLRWHSSLHSEFAGSRCTRSPPATTSAGTWRCSRPTRVRSLRRRRSARPRPRRLPAAIAIPTPPTSRCARRCRSATD